MVISELKCLVQKRTFDYTIRCCQRLW